MSIRIPANNDMSESSAFLRHYLTGALKVQPPPFMAKFDDDTHCLPLDGERDHLNDIGSVQNLLIIGSSRSLRELEQSRLRLVADGDNLAGPQVSVLESHRANCDGGIRELA